MTFAAPSSGASASLSTTSAVVMADGQASVTATANAIGGSYTVTASANVGESVAQLGYALTNLVVPTFSGLSDPSITYGTSTTTLSGTLAGGPNSPVGDTISVTLDGVTLPATVEPGGAALGHVRHRRVDGGRLAVHGKLRLCGRRGLRGRRRIRARSR